MSAAAAPAPALHVRFRWRDADSPARANPATDVALSASEVGDGTASALGKAVVARCAASVPGHSSADTGADPTAAAARVTVFARPSAAFPWLPVRGHAHVSPSGAPLVDAVICASARNAADATNSVSGSGATAGLAVGPSPASLSGRSVEYSAHGSDCRFGFHDEHVTFKTSSFGGVDLGRLRGIVISDSDRGEDQFRIKAMGNDGMDWISSCDASAAVQLREAVVAYGLTSTDDE